MYSNDLPGRHMHPVHVTQKSRQAIQPEGCSGLPLYTQYTHIHRTKKRKGTMKTQLKCVNASELGITILLSIEIGMEFERTC